LDTAWTQLGHILDTDWTQIGHTQLGQLEDWAVHEVTFDALQFATLFLCSLVHWCCGFTNASSNNRAPQQLIVLLLLSCYYCCSNYSL
jgi:hypothetical protein